MSAQQPESQRQCCDHDCNQGDDRPAFSPISPVWSAIYYAGAIALCLLLLLVVVNACWGAA